MLERDLQEKHTTAYKGFVAIPLNALSCYVFLWQLSPGVPMIKETVVEYVLVNISLFEALHFRQRGSESGS